MHNGSAKVNCIIPRIMVILSVVCISVLDTEKYTSGYNMPNFCLNTLLTANSTTLMWPKCCLLSCFFQQDLAQQHISSVVNLVFGAFGSFG